VFSLSGAPSKPGVAGPSPTPAGAALRMALVGADPTPEVAGRGPLPGVVSYFTGSDPEGWHTGIPTFGRVRYRDVYPGTDLVFRGTREALEYDFRLAPEADPGAIALRFEGAEDVRINSDGDLVISTAVGELVHRAPVVYQEVGGERRDIPGAYRLRGDGISFDLGAYDPTLPLVIDPVVLRYSTFLGGSGLDQGLHIAVDGYSRQAYITGENGSADFPTTPGAFDRTYNEVFVTKLGPTGATLAYSTFLGGSGLDRGVGLAVDGAGAAFVTGFTEDADTDFPTTPGAIDRTHNGGFADAFVTKLGPTGAALAYSTFLGGSGDDRGSGIAVDGAGAAFVTGFTEDADTDFPTTPGAIDRTHNGGFADAFVTKLGPTGSALSYSTFLGGSADDFGFGIAVDGAGAAYVTGEAQEADTDFPTTPNAIDRTHNGGFADAFVTKVGSTGAALSYSTFLGGAGVDRGTGIAVDGAGAAYITGENGSDDFPTTAGAFDRTHNGGVDVFVTKVGPTGAALSYSTLLGGSGFDAGLAIAVGGSRQAYVTGETDSTDLPTTAGAFDRTHNGGDDAFVTKLLPAGGALSYSTFLGGSAARLPDRAAPATDQGLGIAVDGMGAAYVTGRTLDGDTDFPTTAGAFDETHNGFFDAFVTKLVEPTPPPPPGAILTCRGRAATHIGTVGDDSMTGTPGSDVIIALAGDDVVKALSGSDVICAGQDHDTATGGKGRDTVQGEDGKDRLTGGGGNDELSGGRGTDMCIGGFGEDVARNCEREKSIP
jgi:hypothetical protein